MDNKMQMFDVVSGATAKTGATVAVASGTTQLLGWTPDQWAIAGVIIGSSLAILGFLFNSWIRWADYQDKKKHRIADLNLKLAQIRKQRSDLTS